MPIKFGTNKEIAFHAGTLLRKVIPKATRAADNPDGLAPNPRAKNAYPTVQLRARAPIPVTLVADEQTEMVEQSGIAAKLTRTGKFSKIDNPLSMLEGQLEAIQKLKKNNEVERQNILNLRAALNAGSSQEAALFMPENLQNLLSQSGVPSQSDVAPEARNFGAGAASNVFDKSQASMNFGRERKKFDKDIRSKLKAAESGVVLAGSAKQTPHTVKVRKRFDQMELAAAGALKQIELVDFSAINIQALPLAGQLMLLEAQEQHATVKESINLVLASGYEKVEQFRNNRNKVGGGAGSASEADFRRFGLDYFRARLEEVEKSPSGEIKMKKDGTPSKRGLLVDMERGLAAIVTRNLQVHSQLQGGGVLVQDDAVVLLGRTLSPKAVDDFLASQGKGKGKAKDV